MHVTELFKQDIGAAESVPNWMKGAFRRRCISFANGLSDDTTRVFWLQSDSLTIDLRLPDLSEQLANQMDPNKVLDYEAWYAHSVWHNQQLSWQNGEAFQLYNRWPEPALLSRVGNCMMEFAPSGAYVEDWRLMSDQPGPLIGLELISERDMLTGEHWPRRGALIINNSIAGLVIGRRDILHEVKPVSLSAYKKQLNISQTDNLLNFETAIAVGDIRQGYTVAHSLNGGRIGQNLTDLNGFENATEAGFCKQIVEINGQKIERTYRVDCFYARFEFSSKTAASPESDKWFTDEEKTLTRYTKTIY